MSDALDRGEYGAEVAHMEDHANSDGWTKAENWHHAGDGQWWEWWDGDDAPKLRLLVPSSVEFTPIMKDLIEEAYTKGDADGELRGRIYQQADIRRAIGI